MGKGSWIGIISMGNHGKSQVYNTWLISVGKNQKRPNSMGQPGAHFNRKFQVQECSIGHLHFKHILCKTFVSLNGKEGTTKDSFQWEIYWEEINFIFQWELRVKLEVGVSGFRDILISNTHSARPLSLSMGKKGQPGAHFNGKSQIYNTWLISVGKY